MRRPKKRSIITLTIMTLLILVFISGCSASSDSVDETVQQAVPVTVELVQEMTIEESFLGLGRIEAQTSITVQPGAQQMVEEVYVKAGDVVEVGDQLFKLDQESLELNYNALESQLRTIRDTIYLQYLDSKNTLENNEVLLSQGAISKAQYDASLTALRQVEKQYYDAATSYNNQVENVKMGISDRTITSPVSGKVAAVNIVANENTTAQSTIVIINDESVIAISEVTSDRINHLTIGDSASIYPDGDPNKVVIGEVVRFNEIPNNVTGLYEVEIAINNEAHELRTGEYVEVDFIIDERVGLVVPLQAVQSSGEKRLVYISSENKAYSKEVMTGQTIENMIEITSGLEIGERVIVRGSTYVKEGTEIIEVE